MFARQARKAILANDHETVADSKVMPTHGSTCGGLSGVITLFQSAMPERVATGLVVLFWFCLFRWDIYRFSSIIDG